MASVLTMPNSDNIYVWNNESCVRFEYRTSFRSLNCYWTKEDAVKIAEAILKEVEELEKYEQEQANNRTNRSGVEEIR